MRRIKQQLSDEECIKILNEEPRGILSVLGEDDYPYGLPLDFIYHDNKIIFHSAMEGHMYDSIKKHDKVSFCVLDRGKKIENEWYYVFNSVILFGKVKTVTGEKERLADIRLLGNRYFPSEDYTEYEMRKAFERVHVFELNIEHMTGKRVTEK